MRQLPIFLHKHIHFFKLFDRSVTIMIWSYLFFMDIKVKRIGYLPRKRVLEIIDEISKSESISRSKVVGILVEEALDARGIVNFGYSNLDKNKIFNSKNYPEHQRESKNLNDAEDEFVDDSGYTISSHKTLDRTISSADIELANKINILKDSGLI